MVHAQLRWRHGWLLLAVAVLMATFVPAPDQSSRAQVGDHQSFYLPWVPHNDTANGQGPWFGKISIHNLSDDLCAVAIEVGRPGSWSRTAQLSFPGGASRSISSRSLALPSPGAPVRIDSVCPITATVKMVTPDVDRSPWSDGANVVTGYTGISYDDVQTSIHEGRSSWFLPIVQTNSGWNSFIRIANLQVSGAADVTIRLYSDDNPLGADGELLEIERKISVGSTDLVDVLGELHIQEWVGFAEIEADGAIGVFTTRSKPSTDMAITNVASAAGQPSEEGRYVLGAPLLFTAYNGWNTGINLANISDQDAEVRIRYYESAGSMIREEQIELRPHSMDYIYTPNDVEEEEFVGSASIESNVPIIAAVDEVKYRTGDGLSYVASMLGQQRAAIPITFREDPDEGRHDNSGINIHNLNPDAGQTVQIRLLDSSGNSILEDPVTLTMPAGGNNFIYLPELDDIEPGTVATALITSEEPAGFVALSNNVNYSVPGDGAVTFSASGENGYYRVLGSSGD
ncbi:MAG: hypothetical protein ACOC9Y_02780 [Chloroflexota bacterium]